MKKSEIKNRIDKVYQKLIADCKLKGDEEFLIRSYIAGGCFASMLLKQPIKDYDMYFLTQTYANDFVEHIKKECPEQISFESENAVTLKNRVQLMTKYTGSSNTTTKSFDFEHLHSYMEYQKEPYIYSYVYKRIVEKELVYSGSIYPLASLLRTRKYIKRGFSISGEQMLKIVFDIIAMFDIDSKIGSIEYDPNVVIKYGDITRTAIDTNLMEKSLPVDVLIDQMSGIDPLTIQVELARYAGTYLSLKDIIEILNNN